MQVLEKGLRVIIKLVFEDMRIWFQYISNPFCNMIPLKLVSYVQYKKDYWLERKLYWWKNIHFIGTEILYCLLKMLNSFSNDMIHLPCTKVNSKLDQISAEGKGEVRGMEKGGEAEGVGWVLWSSITCQFPKLVVTKIKFGRL